MRPSDPVRLVRFDDLPAPVRARFVACVDGSEAPRPILATTFAPRARVLASIALVLGILLGALLWFGWGIDPDDELTAGAWVTARYAIFVLPFVASLAAALHAGARARTLPWASGRYLFPATYVDATGPVLRVASLDRLSSAREIAFGDSGNTLVELRFDDGHVETLTRKPHEVPLDQAAVLRVRRQLAAVMGRGDEAELATLDPLALAEEGTEVVGGYRATVRRATRSEGPRSRPMPRWLAHPRVLAALGAAAATAALGLYALPALALARARASHTPAALSRVAHAWPFLWVQRASGVRVLTAAEAAADLGRRVGDPEGVLARAILPVLRETERRGDPRVPAYFELDQERPAALATFQGGADSARRIGVGFQRALALPPELFAIEGRGAVPAAPESPHVAFRCATEPSSRAYELAGQSYPAFVLACEAWIASAASPERVATVRVEPSPSLDLARLITEDAEDAGKDAMSSAGVAARVHAEMMDSALDGIEPAFERALTVSTARTR